MMQLQAQINNDQSLEGVRLLVVEDDAILLMDLEQILRSAGAEIVALCRSVTDALDVLTRDRVSAAVLDFRVGTETVAPVARRLRQRGTPFIFYTGQLADDPALAEWPNYKVVTKPAPARTIVTAIADVLGPRSSTTLQ